MSGPEALAVRSERDRYRIVVIFALKTVANRQDREGE
ncbi:hypothetical protein KR51_00029320 [Rubidibacter lacunae KORDI 51-2]|uniref:Uncharacterized protein n=1 Tax=Rubidibacter lacunae KORDI 51-2 TaxID=582515 RepID=U5DKZ6_9CHRO|nr:hypothetical protein KR51_00029320 [Rubidibacter lacunae KORDI 51-2]